MNGAAEFCSNLNIYTNKKALYEYKKTIKRSNGRGIVYTLLGIFLISLIARYEFESDSPFWTYISGFALLCGVIKCLQVAEGEYLCNFFSFLLILIVSAICIAVTLNFFFRKVAVDIAIGATNYNCLLFWHMLHKLHPMVLRAGCHC